MYIQHHGGMGDRWRAFSAGGPYSTVGWWRGGQVALPPFPCWRPEVSALAGRVILLLPMFMVLLLAPLEPGRSPIAAQDAPVVIWLVTDHSDNTVLRYDASGQYLDEYVPAGAGGLQDARGFTFAPDGSLLMVSAQASTSSVLQFDGATGAFVKELATGGGLDHPYSIAFGPAGSAQQNSMFVASQDNNVVSAFSWPSGESLGLFVSAGAGGLDAPRLGRFGPDGNLYVASRNTDSILRYHGSSGTFMDAFIPHQSGGLMSPIQFAWGPDGHLYAGSEDTNAILRYDGASGAFIDVFVDGNQPSGGDLSQPAGLVWGPDGALYVASRGNGRIVRYDATGTYLGVFIANRGVDPTGSPLPLLDPEFVQPCLMMPAAAAGSAPLAAAGPIPVCPFASIPAAGG